MDPSALATEAIPISTLQPQLPAPATKSINAVVTLLWPYSSVQRSCALLLAEPDFRLRRRCGQVRVTFSGHAAQAVATSGIGIGDDVQLSLSGVQWRTVGEEEAVQTPGKSVEWELLFAHRLRMRVVRDGSEMASLDISHEATPEPEETRHTPEAAALRTPAPIVGRLSGPILHGREAWASPAFVKRARLSLDSLFKPTFDPFADLDNESEERNRKRRRRSFREIGVWTYAARTPSPEKEDASSSDVVKKVGPNDDQTNERVRMPETPESAEAPVAEAHDDELVQEKTRSTGPVEADANEAEKLHMQASTPLPEQDETVIQSEIPFSGEGMVQTYQGLEDAMEAQFFHEATQDIDMMGGDTEENTEVDEHEDDPEDYIPGHSLMEAEMLQGDQAEPNRRPFEIPDTFADMSPSQLLAQEQDQEYAGDTEPDSDADVFAESEDPGEMTPTEMDSEEEENNTTPPKPSLGKTADHSQTEQPHGRGASLSDEAEDDQAGRDAGEKLDIPVMASSAIDHDDHTPDNIAQQQAGIEGLPAPTMPPPPLLSLRNEFSQESETPSLAPSLSKEMDAPITPLLQPVTSANLPLPSPFPGATDAPPPLYQHPQTSALVHEEKEPDMDKPAQHESSAVAESAMPATTGQDVFRTSGFWGMVQEVEATAEENDAYADKHEMSDDMFDDEKLDERFRYGLDGSRSMTAGQPAKVEISPESHKEEQVPKTEVAKPEGANEEAASTTDDQAVEVSVEQGFDGESIDSSHVVIEEANAEVPEAENLATSDASPDEPTNTKSLKVSHAELVRDAEDLAMTQTVNAAESVLDNQQAPMNEGSDHETQAATAKSNFLEIDPALLQDSSITAVQTFDYEEEDTPHAPQEMSSTPKSELSHRPSSTHELSSSPVVEQQPYTWGQETYEPSSQPDISSPPHPDSEHAFAPSASNDNEADTDAEMQDATWINQHYPVPVDARNYQQTETAMPETILAKSASQVDIVDLGSGSDSDEEMPFVPDAPSPDSQIDTANIGETKAVQNIETSAPMEFRDGEIEADIDAKPQEVVVQTVHEEVGTDEAMKESSFYVVSSSPEPPPRSPSPIEHLDLSQVETEYMPYTLSQNYLQASQRFSQQVPDLTQQHAAAWRWRKEVKDSEDSIDSQASISTIRESSPVEDDQMPVPEDLTWQKSWTKSISPKGGNLVASATQEEEEAESRSTNDKFIDLPMKPVRPPPRVPTHSSMLQNDSSMIREIMEQQSYVSQPQQRETLPLQESTQFEKSPTQKASRVVPTHSSMMVDDSSIIRDMRTQPVQSPPATQEGSTSPPMQILRSQVDGSASPQRPSYDLPSEVAETEGSAMASQPDLTEKSNGQVDPGHLHFTAHKYHVPVIPDASTQTKETQSEVNTEQDTVQAQAALLLTPGLSQATTYIEDHSQAATQLSVRHPTTEQPASEDSVVGEVEPAKLENREPATKKPESHLLEMPAKDLGRSDMDEGTEETLNGSTFVDVEPSAKAGATSVKPLSSPPHTQASQGYRTSLSYYTPLANISAYLNSQSPNIDILAVCTRGSKPATRAEKGPRDYNTIFHITDPSLTETAIFQPSIAVQIFRPFKTALPVVERGDIVLLRGFVPKSRNGKVGLLSQEESGWCVWRYGKGVPKDQQKNRSAEAESKKRLSVDKPIWADQTVGLWGDATGSGWGEVQETSAESYPREECNGPPVEVGEGEREEAKRLRGWWGESDDERDDV